MEDAFGLVVGAAKALSSEPSVDDSSPSLCLLLQACEALLEDALESYVAWFTLKPQIFNRGTAYGKLYKRPPKHQQEGESLLHAKPSQH